MPEPAEDLIARKLAAALERLQRDLECVALWRAALDGFQQPVPDYIPNDQYLLRPDSPAKDGTEDGAEDGASEAGLLGRFVGRDASPRTGRSQHRLRAAKTPKKSTASE